MTLTTTEKAKTNKYQHAVWKTNPNANANPNPNPNNRHRIAQTTTTEALKPNEQKHQINIYLLGQYINNRMNIVFQEW